MRINFGRIGAIVSELFDTDEIDIYRAEESTTAYGTTRPSIPSEAIYTGIPAHVAFNSIPNPNTTTTGTMPIVVTATINCSVDVDLQNNDFIRVRKLDTHGNTMGEYEGTIGAPTINQSRKEAVMEARRMG